MGEDGWVLDKEDWDLSSNFFHLQYTPIPPPTHTLAWCFREKGRKELLTSCSYSAVKLGKGFSLKQKEGKCASSEHTQILVHVFSYLRRGAVFSHSNTLRTGSGGWPGAQGLSAAGVGHQSCFGPLWVLAFLCEHFLMLVLTCFSVCSSLMRLSQPGPGSLEIKSCPKGETKDLPVGFLEAFWKELGNSYIIYQYMISLFFKNIFLFFIIYNILTLNMFWSYSSLSPRFSRSFPPPYPPKFKFFFKKMEK